MLISILVGLLTTFLEYLFEKWLKNHLGNAAGARPDLDSNANKQAFLSKVGWRFWLGPDRKDMASKLYDKVVARYASGDHKYSLQPGQDVAAAYKDLAESLTDGLEKEPL